jgi:transposase
LSPGEAHDAPVGRQLLLELGRLPVEVPLLMDRAYEGDETRQLVLEMNMIPVVPPKSNRLEPWEYDRELYKKRNQVERLFRRLKVTCLDFLIHVELRISAFRRIRWACGSPDCCGVARRYTPLANMRSFPWHRPGSGTNWHLDTHLAVVR